MSFITCKKRKCRKISVICSGENKSWSGKSRGILMLTEGGHPDGAELFNCVTNWYACQGESMFYTVRKSGCFLSVLVYYLHLLSK